MTAIDVNSFPIWRQQNCGRVSAPKIVNSQEKYTAFQINKTTTVGRIPRQTYWYCAETGNLSEIC